MSSLLLGVLLALGSGADDPGPRPPAPPVELVLDVRAGRAALVQGTEITSRTRSQGPLRLVGDAYLELGPTAEIHLRRPGLSSFRIQGPAALEWVVPKGGEGSEASEPELRFLRLRSLEVEVRRGGQRIQLPEAWSLELGRAALHASSSSAGLRLEHRGGEPARVLARAPRARNEAPDPLPSGGRLFLPRLER